jgi:hypothetical protein
MRLAPALLAFATSTACVVDASLPNGAVVLCRTDRECTGDTTCDLPSHTCVKPGTVVDVTGPSLVSAKFDPANAGDGAIVTLTLTASEPLSTTAEPKLTFAGDVADPGFVVASRPTPSSIALTLAVAHSTPEGFYTLRSVHLVDAHQNGADSLVDGASLHVDRTAPVIADIALSGALTDGALVLSDQAGTNQLGVQVLVDEELDLTRTAVALGGEALACSPLSGALGIDCTGTVAAGAASGLVDGENAVTVHVVDLAGNFTDAQQPVAVDLNAPSIVGGSVSISVDGRAADPNVGATASDGQTVVVTLLVSEPLAADPVVTVQSTQNLTFDIAAKNGQFYTESLVVDHVLDVGARAIVATLVDRFGHTANAVVVAPLTLASFPLSPCPSAGVCPDADGDGFFGGSPSCPPGLATDCDDGDPLVYPGAPEIPGDGHRNDCNRTSDLAIDETAGIFVAPDGNDVTGDGSRAHPYASISGAAPVAVAAGKILFAAVGDYAEPNGLEIDAPFVGGLDRQSWTPTSTKSHVTNPNSDPRNIDSASSSSPAHGLLANVAMDGGFFARSQATAVDVDAGFGIIEGHSALNLVRARAGIVVLDAEAGGSRILDCTLQGNVDAFASGVLVDRSVVGGSLIAETNVAITAVNSAFASPNASDAFCSACSSITLMHDTLLASSGTMVDYSVGVSAISPRLLLVGNILAPTTGATGIFTTGRVDIAAGYDVFAWGQGLVYDREDTSFTLNNDAAGFLTFGQCNWEGCGLTNGDISGSIALAPNDPLHLGGDPSTSVAFRGGEPSLGEIPPDFADLVPASVVADVDGQCRFDSSITTQPNIGPDQ